MEKHECHKHGLTEFTEPNANNDSFCVECCKEVPECEPPHLGMTIVNKPAEFHDLKTTPLLWGGKEEEGNLEGIGCTKCGDPYCEGCDE